MSTSFERGIVETDDDVDEFFNDPEAAWLLEEALRTERDWLDRLVAKLIPEPVYGLQASAPLEAEVVGVEVQHDL